MKAWNKLAVGTLLAVGVSQFAVAQEKVTVFAAASLTNALQDIAAQYEKGKDVKIVSSFASSSTLARQIDQGAPADLFISADQQWMDFAIDKKAMVADTRITLLGNELVLVASKDSKIDKVNIDKKTDWNEVGILRNLNLMLHTSQMVHKPDIIQTCDLANNTRRVFI